eukprot:jgi/Bigna1/72438/fgenesh1_pg.19_\
MLMLIRTTLLFHFFVFGICSATSGKRLERRGGLVGRIDHMQPTAAAFMHRRSAPINEKPRRYFPRPLRATISPKLNTRSCVKKRSDSSKLFHNDMIHNDVNHRVWGLAQRFQFVQALKDQVGPELIPATEMTSDEDDEGSVYEDVISVRKHIHITDDFLKDDLAKNLRRKYNENFLDPRKGHAARFVWDYWHVPEQYTLIRTPASDLKQIFPILKTIMLFTCCRNISPMWLSYYVDGCYQNLHADVPHGPWAFVLSLTDWENRTFSDIMETVQPKFNRLTVFDPRLPHGVRQVSGTQDPRKARLVLHGWFTEPTPFFVGGCDTDSKRYDEQCNRGIEHNAPCNGYSDCADSRKNKKNKNKMIVRSHVTAEGVVESLDWLSDTLVPRPGAKVPALDGQCVEPPEDARFLILEAIWKSIAEVQFPEANGGTNITVPFIFE